MIDASELPNTTYCRCCGKDVPKSELVLAKFLAHDVPELLDGCHCSRECFKLATTAVILSGHFFDGPDGHALAKENRRVYISFLESPLPGRPYWWWCLSDKPPL